MDAYTVVVAVVGMVVLGAVIKELLQNRELKRKKVAVKNNH